MTNDPDVEEQGHASNGYGALGSIGRELAKRVSQEVNAVLLLLDVILAIVAIAGFSTGTSSALYVLIPFAALTAIVAIRRSGQKQLIREIEAPKTTRAKSSGSYAVTSTSAIASKATAKEKNEIVGLLGTATKIASRTLSMKPEHVRSNIFGRTPDGSLKIIDGLTFNMGDPSGELELELPLGVGSTGRAFSLAKPNVATFEDGWAADVLDAPDMRRIHPQLRWIISIPVTAGNPPVSVWVLNVDGIIEKRPREQVKDALPDLVNVGQMLAVVVAKLIDRSTEGR